MRLVLSIMSETISNSNLNTLTLHYKELQARWVLPMPFRQMVLDYRSLPCSDTSTNAKNMRTTSISVQPGSGRDTLFQLGIQSKLRIHLVHLKNVSSDFYFLSTHMSKSGLADQWQRIWKHPLDRKQALGFPERRL